MGSSGRKPTRRLSPNARPHQRPARHHRSAASIDVAATPLAGSCGTVRNPVTPVAYSGTVTTEPISAGQLRHDVETVLRDHGFTLEEFLRADIDDLPGWELRDLWLMTREALAGA